MLNSSQDIKKLLVTSLRGRPPKSWSEAVKGDLREYRLSIRDTWDRDKWRDAIAMRIV